MSSGHLKLKGLVKRYGKLEILKGIDLAIAPGEFLTLLGPSGSGKTTTLMLVAGFQSSDGGSIEIDGRDVTHMPAHKRNVGVVFQHYALFPHMSIRDNIAYPLKMLGFPKAKTEAAVSAALTAVQLSTFGERFPSQLSGGQQQRIAVARATVYRPPLLLMDEPLSALDKSLRQDLQAEIRRLHRDLATSILYVTHDQGEALGMSDRIAVMDHGRIVQVDTPSAIYTRPKTRFVASFIGQSNFIEGKLLGIEDDGMGVCRIADGSIRRGRMSGASAVGEAVSLMVRPEHVVAGRTVSTGFGGMTVRLTDIIYQGRFSRCIGRFESGEPCLLELASSDIPAGKEVFDVHWCEQDAVVIPAGEQAGH